MDLKEILVIGPREIMTREMLVRHAVNQVPVSLQTRMMEFSNEWIDHQLEIGNLLPTKGGGVRPSGEASLVMEFPLSDKVLGSDLPADSGDLDET